MGGGSRKSARARYDVGGFIMADCKSEMKYSLSEKVSVILLWIGFLLSVISLLLTLSLRIGHCENLPKGWWIEKHKLINEYRWCRPKGVCGNATFQTKNEAIRDALKVYNFDKWKEDQKRKKEEDEKNWQKTINYPGNQTTFRKQLERKINKIKKDTPVFIKHWDGTEFYVTFVCNPKDAQPDVILVRVWGKVLPMEKVLIEEIKSEGKK